MNLYTRPFLVSLMATVVGLSYHLLSIAAMVIACTLKASIIKKRFAFVCEPDHLSRQFSLTPVEFNDMIQSARCAKEMLGTAEFGARLCVSTMTFRSSLYGVVNTKAAEAFTTQNVLSIRPSHRLAPRLPSVILGSVATQDVSRRTQISYNLIR